MYKNIDLGGQRQKSKLFGCTRVKYEISYVYNYVVNRKSGKKSLTI